MPELSSNMLVGKAATALTADTTYSLLSGMQSDKFFRRVVDLTSMSKHANIIRVRGIHKDFNDVDLTSKMAVGLSETALLAGTSDESSATFSGRRLTPESTRMLLVISDLRLQYVTIEEQGITKTLEDLMVTAFANHVEEVCVKSEDGGSDSSGGTGYLTEIDGWRALAGSGNIYNHGGGKLNSALFREMSTTIPVKWRTAYQDKKKWRIFCHSDVEDYLRDLFAQRSTAMGDISMTADNQITMFGYPLVGVPYIPTALDGVLTMTGTADSYTWLMLARPENMYIGFRPEMKLYQAKNVEGNLIYVSLWAEWAPQFANVAEVVTAVNVDLDVTY